MHVSRADPTRAFQKRHMKGPGMLRLVTALNGGMNHEGDRLVTRASAAGWRVCRRAASGSDAGSLSQDSVRAERRAKWRHLPSDSVPIAGGGRFLIPFKDKRGEVRDFFQTNVSAPRECSEIQTLYSGHRNSCRQAFYRKPMTETHRLVVLNVIGRLSSKLA